MNHEPIDFHTLSLPFLTCAIISAGFLAMLFRAIQTWPNRPDALRSPLPSPAPQSRRIPARRENAKPFSHPKLRRSSGNRHR